MEEKKKSTYNMDNTQVYKIPKDTKTKGKKRTKKQDKKNKKAKKVMKKVLLTILIVILVVAGIVFGKIFSMFKEAKIDSKTVAIKYENSVARDRNGELIAVLSGDENRENISLSEMSKYLPKAFVAIEDERFYDHSGVDIKRTTAATVKWVLSKAGIGSSDYGGSTITQQLIKNSTNEKERSWERKVKEIARAHYIEKELSKEQILETYLNLIYLGQNTYGVEIASNFYFNKSSADLSLAECAFLAGINNSPNSYDPFSDDADTKALIQKRTKIVLGKMKDLGTAHKAGISEEEYNQAIGEVDKGLAFSKGKIMENVYSYHTDAAVNQVIDDLLELHSDWNREYATLYVKSSGLTIYTTQDTNIQKIMESEFADTKYQIKSSKTTDEQGNYVTAQAAMVLIDHTTGQVLATVGGLGEKTAFGLNRATQSLRQTGSSMKPLAVVAPGIDTGILTAATVYDDVPTYFGYWVKNSTGYKGLVTLRYAIASSQNIPMMAGMRDLGVNTSMEYLRKMGISTLVEDDAYLGLALGGLTKGISPLEMAAAYASIANDGVYIEPTFYTKVVDSDGNTILTAEQATEEVMSKQAAYVVKELLTQTVKSGTSTYCAISGMSVTGKTGTTNDDYDRWLCGFTPYYTAAAWFGFDKNETIIWRGTNPAGLIWSSVMKQAHSGLKSKYFADTRPEGVISAKICKSSGKLATENCTKDPRGDQTYTEYFVRGTAPTEQCTCHVLVSICEDTGLLSNEYCPHAVQKVFVTRVNADKPDVWSMANDAQYTLTIKNTCAIHKKPIIDIPIIKPPKKEEPTDPDEEEQPTDPNEEKIVNEIIENLEEIENNSITSRSHIREKIDKIINW